MTPKLLEPTRTVRSLFQPCLFEQALSGRALSGKTLSRETLFAETLSRETPSEATVPAPSSPGVDSGRDIPRDFHLGSRRRCATSAAFLAALLLSFAAPPLAVVEAQAATVAGGSGETGDEAPDEDPLAGVTINIESHDRVTVEGKADSLVRLVREFCLEAGIRLEWVGPEDAPFSGRFRDYTVLEVFERLLEGTSYTVGVKRVGDEERVTWIRVVGASDELPVTTETEMPKTIGSRPGSPRFLEDLGIMAVLKIEDARERYQKIREIRNEMRSQPAKFDAFFDADAQLIADAIRDQEFAKKVLQELLAPEPKRERRAHLSKIISLLSEKK